MPLALSSFKQVPETKHDLDWAELVTLDLSEFDKPGGKQKLAAQLDHAVQHVGFFYVTNFGISTEEVDHQFELARKFFDLSLEEKLKYYDAEEFFRGNSIGYRPTSFREPTNGVEDNTQIYITQKFDGYHEQKHPRIIEENIAEIEKFTRDCHEKVVFKLLRLLAIILELPEEDTLVNKHQYDRRGEDQLRYMHYAHRTPEENRKLGEIYAAGHTDLGTLTLLFRQPVAALQILNSENQWKWVKPQDATLTVNICDALSTISCGYFKSTIHRVHTPPPDQAHLDRVGVLYFARANNDVLLSPIKDSPLLQRLNRTSNELTELGKMMTMEEWVKARQLQHSKRKKPVTATVDGTYEWNEKDLEVIPGLHVKNYN